MAEARRLMDDESYVTEAREVADGLLLLLDLG
jgi:hypothetical protein